MPSAEGKLSSTRLSEAIIASGMRPGIRLSDLYEVCRDAVENGVRSICIPTAYLDDLSVFLRDTGLKASTIISFPTGLLPVEIKTIEIKFAFNKDVEEVYFYPNIGNYLDSRIIEFESELSRVAEESQLIGLNQIKPVVEAELLSQSQIDEVIDILKTSGFNTVMISFGFGLRSITPKELSLIESCIGRIMLEVNCRIGSLEEAEKLIEKRVEKICTIDYRVVFKKGFQQSHFD